MFRHFARLRARVMGALAAPGRADAALLGAGQGMTGQGAVAIGHFQATLPVHWKGRTWLWTQPRAGGILAEESLPSARGAPEALHPISRPLPVHRSDCRARNGIGS